MVHPNQHLLSPPVLSKKKKNFPKLININNKFNENILDLKQVKEFVVATQQLDFFYFPHMNLMYRKMIHSI